MEIIKWVKKFAVEQAKGIPHLLALEGLGEDTERSYSAKSEQNIAERLEKIIMLSLNSNVIT
jgi:hypothetical protein